MKKTYQVLTNLNCNLCCTYCYENKRNEVNSIEDIKKYLTSCVEKDFGIKYIDEEQEGLVVDVIGGESLLYPDMLDEICEHLKYLCRIYEIKDGFMLGMSTNATLLTTPKVQEFILKWKDNISIGFSIDGTKEIHDACRIYPDGSGSYDKAIAGLQWLKTVLPPCRYNVKATYCHDTIDRYAEGVINLINLGFTHIAANVIYEEIWTDEDALKIAEQFKVIIDYVFDNNLQDKINIFQLNPEGMDMSNYGCSKETKKTANHCGSCKYMRCLGFDKKIYGCNRFCTMKEPISIGHLGNDGIEITNQEFIDEVSEQYKLYPEECKKCPFWNQCAACSAMPYETNRDNTAEWFKRKPYCGFTNAMVWGRVYWKHKLKQLKQ